MPSAKRAQREATEDWEQVRMFVASPQQETYELLRPIVLFGRTPAERARETGVAERTLRRKADRFDASGMASLFETTASATHDRRALPAEVRQAILDLKAEYAPLRPNEIATICELRFRRPVSHHTVQRVLAAGVPPTTAARRFPRYRDIADPVERRLFATRYPSPPPFLPAIDAVAWRQALRLPPYQPRRKRQQSAGQAALFSLEDAARHGA